MNCDDDYIFSGPSMTIVVAIIATALFISVIFATDGSRDIKRHLVCIDGHWHLVVDAGPPLLMVDNQDQAVTCKEGDHEPQSTF